MRAQQCRSWTNENAGYLPVLGPDPRPPGLRLRGEAGPDGLADPLWVVTEEPLDSLQSQLAVWRGQQLVSHHLTEQHRT